MLKLKNKLRKENYNKILFSQLENKFVEFILLKQRYTSVIYLKSFLGFVGKLK
jgi:hypothetical protein